MTPALWWVEVSPSCHQAGLSSLLFWLHLLSALLSHSFWLHVKHESTQWYSKPLLQIPIMILLNNAGHLGHLLMQMGTYRRKAAERKEENWNLVRVETPPPNPLIFYLISTAMREKIDFTPSIVSFPSHQYIVSPSLHIFLPQLSYSRSDTCINICWQWSLFCTKKGLFKSGYATT